MPAIKYISRCIYCGVQGNVAQTTASGPPRSTPNSIPGKCPSSPNGKHAPRWEEA